MTQNREIEQYLSQNLNSKIVLFFDFDGTLIETDYANFLSYLKGIQQVIQPGADLTYDPNQRFNREMLEKLFPNLSENQYEEVVKLKEKYYEEYLHKTKLNNLAAKILNYYRQTNKTILVTNCRKHRALMTLNYHGLVERFNHLFYKENQYLENFKNKYKRALSSLNISPDLVFAFENEQDEINNAILAGIPTDNVLSLK